jgi:hypothetical protein
VERARPTTTGACEGLSVHGEAGLDGQIARRCRCGPATRTGDGGRCRLPQSGNQPWSLIAGTRLATRRRTPIGFRSHAPGYSAVTSARPATHAAPRSVPEILHRCIDSALYQPGLNACGDQGHLRASWGPDDGQPSSGRLLNAVEDPGHRDAWDQTPTPTATARGGRLRYVPECPRTRARTDWVTCDGRPDPCDNCPRTANATQPRKAIWRFIRGNPLRQLRRTVANAGQEARATRTASGQRLRQLACTTANASQRNRDGDSMGDVLRIPTRRRRRHPDTTLRPMYPDLLRPEQQTATAGRRPAWGDDPCERLRTSFAGLSYGLRPAWPEAAALFSDAPPRRPPPNSYPRKPRHRVARWGPWGPIRALPLD